MDDDAVFRALADGSRRLLLDRLHKKNGQSLGDLCEGLEMSRQAVAKWRNWAVNSSDLASLE